MARTQYESAVDRAAELEIVREIAAAWDCGYAKLDPHREGLDFALLSESRAPNSQLPLVIGFLEVKDRKIRSGQYPSIIVALQKIVSAKRLHAASSIPCHYAISCLDGAIWFINFMDVWTGIQQREIPLVWGGRTRHTRDKGDWELVAMIPWSIFERLG